MVPFVLYINLLANRCVIHGYLAKGVLEALEAFGLHGTVSDNTTATMNKVCVKKMSIFM